MPLCIEVYFFKLEFKLGRGAEAMLGAPAAVGASWRFTAADAGDRADKFGWLGVKGKEGTSSADRISFRLEFSGLGFLAFEFLRSYAWDGRVSIIIDGKRPLLDLGSPWSPPPSWPRYRLAAQRTARGSRTQTSAAVRTTLPAKART